jgi:hypothetical protein
MSVKAEVPLPYVSVPLLRKGVIYVDPGDRGTFRCNLQT